MELHLIKGCIRKWEVIYTHAFIKTICIQLDPLEGLNKWINATKKQSDPEVLQNSTDCFTAQNIQLSDCEANHASLKWGTKGHQLTNMDANNENFKQTKCFMGNKEIWLTEVKDTWGYLFFYKCQTIHRWINYYYENTGYKMIENFRHFFNVQVISMSSRYHRPFLWNFWADE